VTASPNGWYIAGNPIFGGLIGWFIVDPFNGKMYALEPEKIETALTAHDKASLNPTPSDGIRVMLVQDVPAALMPAMTPPN
jgi:hypothetical protein